MQSQSSQAELDKKDSELNLHDNTLSSEEQEKKDSFSNNNIINEKVSEEPPTQREISQKPFNKNGLLSKCHLKLATYIEQNKDVTLAGTKRFTDKSGEYYLKNVQLRKKKGQEGVLSKKLSLRSPQTLENCFSRLNGNLNKIKKNATKIITVLPENSLTPIPVKEKNAVRGVAGIFNKKQYQNAERTAVFIRRMEYSSGVQKHLRLSKKNDDSINKIIIIQEWWKTMYKILRLQKCIRGFLFRRKLMKNLEHQERLLQFITEFDNIHGFHLYKKFFNNLKQLVNQIKSKKSEMLEDFGEKMEKIEKLNYLKKLKNKFSQWKNIADEDKKMEKAKNFYKYKLVRKIMMSWNRAYKFKKKIIKLLKSKLNEEKRILLDELYKNKIKTDNNYSKAINKLKTIFNNNDNNLKKENFEKMKLFDFLDHLKDLQDKINNKNKKLFLNKLKHINDYYNKKNSFNQWKASIAKNKLLKKLLRNKKKELEKKKNFTIDSNVNNLKVLNVKNNNDDDINKINLTPIKQKNNEISISNENNISIIKTESPQKNLSIGNAGLDFSIIAPELYQIYDIDPSKKIYNIQNLNDIFDQTKNVFKLIKLKNNFTNWKNKLYLKKILDELKNNKKEKENRINQGKNKLLKILKNKLNQKKFGLLDDNDMLEKAFQIWKDLEMSEARKLNIKKLKLKLVKNKKDEGTQKNFCKNDYIIDPLVNEFEIIADEKNKGISDNNNGNKNIKKEVEKNNENKKLKNNYNQLKSQNIINDNIYNKRISDKEYDFDNDNEDNINNDNNEICRTELFTLDRTNINKENPNEEEKEKNENDKNRKGKFCKKKRLPKKLLIEKDNSFSIINKKFIDNEIKSLNDKIKNNKENINNNEENKDNNDIEKPFNNKLINDELNNDYEQEIEKYGDINKIKEINEFFPKEEKKEEEIVFLYQKTDNFVLGPNSSEILIEESDSVKNLINNLYDNKISKLSQRKIMPYDKNIKKNQVELFSIISTLNKKENQNLKNANDINIKEDIIKNKNDFITNKDNFKNDNSNKDLDMNEKEKNNIFDSLKNKNKTEINGKYDLFDENDYKLYLYHAHKFTIFPKDFIPTEEMNSKIEDEKESDKIIELPKITNNSNKKIKFFKKPFNNLIIQKDQTFSILENDKLGLNKIINEKLEKMNNGQLNANLKDEDDINKKHPKNNLNDDEQDRNQLNKNKTDNYKNKDNNNEIYNNNLEDNSENNKEKDNKIAQDKDYLNLYLEEDSRLLKINNKILPEQLNILNNEIKKIKPDLYRIKKIKIIKFNQNHHDNLNNANKPDLINEQNEENLEDNINPSKIKINYYIDTNQDNDNSNDRKCNNNYNDKENNQNFSKKELLLNHKINQSKNDNNKIQNENEIAFENIKNDSNKISSNNNDGKEKEKIDKISEEANKNKVNNNFKEENENLLNNKNILDKSNKENLKDYDSKNESLIRKNQDNNNDKIDNGYKANKLDLNIINNKENLDEQIKNNNEELEDNCKIKNDLKGLNRDYLDKDLIEIRNNLNINNNTKNNNQENMDINKINNNEDNNDLKNKISYDKLMKEETKGEENKNFIDNKEDNLINNKNISDQFNNELSNNNSHLHSEEEQNSENNSKTKSQIKKEIGEEINSRNEEKILNNKNMSDFLNSNPLENENINNNIIENDIYNKNKNKLISTSNNNENNVKENINQSNDSYYLKDKLETNKNMSDLLNINPLENENINNNIKENDIYNQNKNTIMSTYSGGKNNLKENINQSNDNTYLKDKLQTNKNMSDLLNSNPLENENINNNMIENDISNQNKNKLISTNDDTKNNSNKNNNQSKDSSNLKDKLQINKNMSDLLNINPLENEHNNNNIIENDIYNQNKNKLNSTNNNNENNNQSKDSSYLKDKILNNKNLSDLLNTNPLENEKNNNNMIENDTYNENQNKLMSKYNDITNNLKENNNHSKDSSYLNDKILNNKNMSDLLNTNPLENENNNNNMIEDDTYNQNKNKLKSTYNDSKNNVKENNNQSKDSSYLNDKILNNKNMSDLLNTNPLENENNNNNIIEDYTYNQNQNKLMSKYNDSKNNLKENNNNQSNDSSYLKEKNEKNVNENNDKYKNKIISDYDKKNDNINITKEDNKFSQYNIFSTEKIDLEFVPNQSSGINNDKPKKEENRIVKINNLKIYDLLESKKKQNIFTNEKQDIQKFDVLIEREISLAKNYNNSRIVEKKDKENQTLKEEYIISDQNKNEFTIYSNPNQKLLLFNKERTQFDPINSFSIKIDKKKINKNDLNKGLKTIINTIKKNIYKDLTNLINNKNHNDNIQKVLSNLIKKRNDNSLIQKFFDNWKNSPIINPMNYMNKDNKNKKKRISMRKNLKKRIKNKSPLKLMNKIKMQNDLLKKILKKWREKSLNKEDISHRDVVQKIIEYKKKQKKDDLNSNKNEELLNKLKKALLQSLLHLYKDQRNKLCKKYLNKWKQKSKMLKKYVKKFINGSGAYKSQDKKLLDSSISMSNLDSNSSKIKTYIPPKVSKYSSIDKIKKNYNNNIIDKDMNNIKKSKNRNKGKNTNDKSNYNDKKKNPFYYNNTYEDKNQNIYNEEFFKGEQKIPNQILEKIKNRTEKYSKELNNLNITESSDINGHKRVVSMLQRIQHIYHSPNSSVNNSIISNKISSTNQSNKDIFISEKDTNYKKKNKKLKTKRKYLDKLNQKNEENKDQNSDDSSVNNSIKNCINLKETKTENLKPIIYTSQSFFIDKKAMSPEAEQIPSISYYKNIANKFPMKMKGDFRKLIEKNPDILKQKNPRIQITNATCELEQFEERNKNAAYLKNLNLLKINPNMNIKYKKKQKDLRKVVNNCDRDIYESQIPYETQQQRWISMSIPLKNDVAKWEFLNAVKGERHKNNANKFELIQKNKTSLNNTYNSKTVKLIEHKRGISNKSHSLSKISEDSIENNVQYNLREMNYSQFYRSPLNTYKNKMGEDILSPPPVKLIKRGDKNTYKKRNANAHHSRISSIDKNSKSSNDNNIEELSGENYE